MNSEPFDQDAAKKNLLAREKSVREANERTRIDLLDKCKIYLKQRFAGNNIEVYLVGSITRPYDFRKSSDIDIVLKGFEGDRFEIWAELEQILNHRIEVIIFESCHFQDHIIQEGLKIE